jgi:hypothetical protein
MFVTVMTTFGTAALFWSDTVPSICPFKACDWAKADGTEADNNMPAMIKKTRMCGGLPFIKFGGGAVNQTYFLISLQSNALDQFIKARVAVQ